jgi:hypothetical protein
MSLPPIHGASIQYIHIHYWVCTSHFASKRLTVFESALLSYELSGAPLLRMSPMPQFYFTTGNCFVSQQCVYLQLSKSKQIVDCHHDNTFCMMNCFWEIWLEAYIKVDVTVDHYSLKIKLAWHLLVWIHSKKFICIPVSGSIDETCRWTAIIVCSLNIILYK